MTYLHLTRFQTRTALLKAPFSWLVQSHRFIYSGIFRRAIAYHVPDIAAIARHDAYYILAA